MVRKPKVGEILCLVSSCRYYGDINLKNDTAYDAVVVSVGRKYFKVKKVNNNFTIQFDLERWRQNTGYSPQYTLYESKEIYMNKVKRDKYLNAYYRKFNYNSCTKDITLEQLEAGAKIFGITIDDVTDKQQ